MTDLREQWIQKICTGIATAVGRHALMAPARIVGEPSDLDLLRALLVLRIAVLDARGRSTAHIIGLLARHPVFAEPKPDTEQLASLVKHVRWHVENDGLTGSVLLFGLGLRAEYPESAYALLLDHWFRRRSRVTTIAKTVRELTRHWGMETSRAAEAMAPRSLRPLEVCSETIWSRLEAEPDTRVQHVAALALIRAGNEAQKLWTKGFPALGVRHLRELGTRVAGCTAASGSLREAIRDSRPNHSLRPVFTRALDVVDEQLEVLSEAIGCLSATERDLLRTRTQKERFQDACILTFLNCSLHFRDSYRVGSCVPDAQALHGTYGPLPWWNVIVRTEEETEAARAALSEGVLPLGFERDPGHASRLLLICRKPRTESLGIRAHFVFDLDNPAHACELLLMAKRSGVPIDVYAESHNEPDEWDIESTHLGTLYAPIGPELASLVTEVASAALTRALPGAHDCDYDEHEGIEPLSEALRRLAPARVQHFSSGRHITASSYRDIKGGVVALSAHPPVELSGFSRGTKRGQQSGHSRETRTRTPMPPPRATGFVYVQRNPAFPDMLKIGYSARLAEDRAKDLYGTSVPFPYEVLFRALSSRPEDVERAVHRLLTAQRVNADREFFRVTLDVAIEAIRHCQGESTGITSWEPIPAIHRLREGDRVVLPLRAGQLFALTAYPHLLSSSAEVLDFWQAHGDGDLLEIHATRAPGHVAGISDNDLGAYEDPVPFLNREKSARNGMLLGRERLVAGDRLIWFSDEEGPTGARGVVFEADAFCQVTYRTSVLRRGPLGIPLLLNYLDRDVPEAMGLLIRDVVALDRPRTWAPRNPQEEDGWAVAATDPQPPEHWLPQLERRRKNVRRDRP
ncbi:GIY-YIG nuclease family protein [Streptomyces oryzae]|uniref:GIY-YIG nuclease family protein n=1 Tax=Streptomyces oryzae TaxID=1434886 RepID=A0ABS3X4T6_9ACTN|nr:GIY-YIG nuclease family protein [Streptomyces oryzae]MBO8190344.1 GIY-YIG nuclease family protein [Streptomyces oryzae]